jgi:hypothetical protein
VRRTPAKPCSLCGSYTCYGSTCRLQQEQPRWDEFDFACYRIGMHLKSCEACRKDEECARLKELQQQAKDAEKRVATR